jgi:uncharacterized membrane protein
VLYKLSMTSRLSPYVFSALLVVCTILTVTNTVSLPESVAIHFNAKNSDDAWISRDLYRVLIL